jgi:hypothetical protein
MGISVATRARSVPGDAVLQRRLGDTVCYRTSADGLLWTCFIFHNSFLHYSLGGEATRPQHIYEKHGFKVAQLIPPNFLFQGFSGVGNPLLFDRVYNTYLERAPILINSTSNEKECGDSCEGKVKVRATVSL